MNDLKAKIAKVLKAGYELELLQPHPIARACAAYMGRVIRPISVFVKA